MPDRHTSAAGRTDLPLQRKSGKWSGYEAAVRTFLAQGVEIEGTMAVQN